MYPNEHRQRAGRRAHGRPHVKEEAPLTHARRTDLLQPVQHRPLDAVVAVGGRVQHAAPRPAWNRGLPSQLAYGVRRVLDASRTQKWTGFAAYLVGANDTIWRRDLKRAA